MTPHTKIATIVAPFLLIGGYIVADYFQSQKEKNYLTGQAKQVTAYELNKSFECGLTERPCEFKKNSLVLIMSSDSNSYHIEANQPLEGITLGLAQSDRETRTLKMMRIDELTHWAIPIRKLTNFNTDEALIMRLATESKGERFYVEFEINPTGPWSAN